MAVNVVTDSVPTVLVELEVIEESEPKVVEDSESVSKVKESVSELEVEEPLIDIRIFPCFQEEMLQEYPNKLEKR